LDIYKIKQDIPAKIQKIKYFLEYFNNKGMTAIKTKNPFPEVNTAKKATSKLKKNLAKLALPLKIQINSKTKKGKELCCNAQTVQKIF
jgi:hypothetical protein